jgi:hypothetical protein
MIIKQKNIIYGFISLRSDLRAYNINYINTYLKRWWSIMYELCGKCVRVIIIGWEYRCARENDKNAYVMQNICGSAVTLRVDRCKYTTGLLKMSNPINLSFSFMVKIYILWRFALVFLMKNILRLSHVYIYIYIFNRNLCKKRKNVW